jgi:hypothetical protein
MTGELNLGANSIGGTLKSVTPYIGPGTTDIDWTSGNFAAMTFGASNSSFAFTANPSNAGLLILELTQDATGSRTATWPAAVKWPNGTAPTLTTAANSVDVIRFFFDGTNYYGTYDLNFS